MNKTELKNNINKYVESKNFKSIIYTLGVLFILFFVFQAGVVVGFKKASFHRDWGDNYEKNFGSRRGMPKFIKDNPYIHPNPLVLALLEQVAPSGRIPTEKTSLFS